MNLIQEFVATQNLDSLENYHSKWSAPSNIALIKYWGKKENQIPANPSISFTLNNCKTITDVSFVRHDSNKLQFDFFFERNKKDEFLPKLQTFFDKILPYCSYLSQYHLTISSENTFPHSSGIASSASAMAALAVNIMSFEKQLFPEISDDYFYKKASFLARLGSGSACRSIKDPVVVWGKHEKVLLSNDLYGVGIQELHPIFKSFQDTILLVDKGEKQVSSTLGHQLMNNHPYADNRFLQAHHNLSHILEILKQGDVEAFISIVESEAVTLHAMMMTSMPYFILMKPNTLEIINKIWKFREKTKTPLCFTLDAGANVHLLYPENVCDVVLSFIDTELVGYCQNKQYICDKIGNGAIKL